MPTLIMTKQSKDLDASIKSKTMTFLQKLVADDTAPGLHIEPIKGSADSRVRTGRVDLKWRAVLFRLDSNGEPHYVVHGVWPHDKAIAIAEKTTLTVNPVNGLPQFEAVDPPVPVAPVLPVPVPVPVAPSPPAPPLLVAFGYTAEDLVGRLGLPDELARRALTCADDDAVLALAESHDGWQGMALVDLATGVSIEEIVGKLGMTTPGPASAVDDTDLLTSLREPAAAGQFAFVDGEDELRRVIETGNFAAWRVFLHPQQRRYAVNDYSGAFRLSGGAGTGKTVVLVHRAVRLARADPTRRVVLTTFTVNLAHSLREQVMLLDPAVPSAAALGAAGVFVAGIDALASAVLTHAGTAVDEASTVVLGEPRSTVSKRTPADRWRTVIEASATVLPPEVANGAFLADEYSLVVLPHRITTEAQYLKVRRSGRGVALDRGRRLQVWHLIAAYRAQSRIDGTLDFAEAAAVAAAHLDAHPEARPADHLLVDEAQDLTPPQLQLVRALTPHGPNDLFLAEDSHQRIYGPRVVLRRYDIEIVGRSQRLSLNYRTTAQNLRYALQVLQGADYVDLEGEPEHAAYRSARSGPAPTSVVAAGLSDELSQVERCVRGWLDARRDPATIAVLVPDRFQRERVVTRLGEVGIAARAVDSGAAPTDRVAVMTMHRAKGMEYGAVLVTDVGFSSPGEQKRLAAMDPSERADAELRRRSLLYVAATRARDELAVVVRRS